MSEILNALKLKEKISIISTMSVLAVVLTVISALLSFSGADRHDHIYDYSLEIENGSFTLVGHCTVDGCENGEYREQGISGVRVSQSVAPGCNYDGKQVYAYDIDGVTVTCTETQPAVHKYDYSISDVGGSKWLTANCTCEGCESPTLFLDNISDLKLVSVREADCFMPRLETYSYVRNGVTSTFSTLVGESFEHTLGGKNASEVANEDGSFTYGIEGIKLLGFGGLSCGNVGNGYFQCDTCGQVVTIAVVQPDHSFVYDESDMIAPTFETDGSANLHCENYGCEEKVGVTLPAVTLGVNAESVSPATELHPEIIHYTFISEEHGFTIELDCERGEALAHNYVYELVAGDTEGSFNLVGSCGQPECQAPTVIEQNVKVDAQTITSTCEGNGGGVLYSYEKDGVTYELTVLQPGDPTKHSFTYAPSDITMPTHLKTGLITVSCSKQDCTWSHKEILPVVQVGVNATVQTNNGDGTVNVKYTHTTEYGYSVILNLTVVESHEHAYVYELNRGDGNDCFDVTKLCIHPRCGYAQLLVDEIHASSLMTYYTPASCTEQESVTYIYIGKDADKTIEVTRTEKLGLGGYGHEYSYSLEPTGDVLGRFDLVGKCGNCGHTTTEKNVTTTFRDTSTCVTKGILTWTYNKGGVFAEFSMESPDFGAHDFSQGRIEVVVRPTLEETGTAVIYCGMEGCTHSETIYLPKVDIGVNANLVYADEGIKIVDYIYFSEEYRREVALRLYLQ